MNWRYWWHEAAIPFCIVLAVIAVPSALLMWIGALWDAHVCTRFGEILAVESQYTVATGCMVKYDGRWEPLNWQKSVRIKGKFE